MQSEPLEAESPKRKRRRLQFSLRTLLIVVTLLAIPCAYAGWQVKIVRERQAWCDAHPYRGSSTNLNFGRMLARSDADRSPSLIRRLIGDHVNNLIVVPPIASAEEKETAISLFPEAGVVEELKGQ